MAAALGTRVSAQDATVTESASSTGFAAIIQPYPTGMTLSLDNSIGITIKLGAESVHLSPEEIMAALRVPSVPDYTVRPQREDIFASIEPVKPEFTVRILGD